MFEYVCLEIKVRDHICRYRTSSPGLPSVKGIFTTVLQITSFNFSSTAERSESCKYESIYI